MANRANEVIDLSAEDNTKQAQALQALERNFTHLLISAQEAEGKTGPKLTFGERVLIFKPEVPSTAMAELLANGNKIEGLRSYLRTALKEECKEDFDYLQGDLSLASLNAIVETVSEAAVPLDSEKS